MKCSICNKETAQLEKHHIIPVSRGGVNKDSNMILLCGNCHGLAHNVSFSENRSGLIHEGLKKQKLKSEKAILWLNKNTELVNNDMDKLFYKNEKEYNLLMALIENNRFYPEDFMDLFTTKKLKKTFRITIYL